MTIPGIIKNFTLVPRFDKWESLVRFVATPLGGIVFSLAFSAGLYFLKIRHWWFCGVVVLLTVIAPKLTLRWWFPLANVLWWFLLPPGFYFSATTFFTMPDQVFIQRYGPLLIEPVYVLSPSYLGTLAVALCAVIGIYAIAFRWAIRESGHYFSLQVLTGALLAGITLSIAATYVSAGTALLLLLCAVTLARFSIFFCYAVQDSKLNPHIGFWKQLTIFTPFWGLNCIPLVRGYSQLESTLISDPLELARNRLKGLKLLVWLKLLAVFALGFKALFEPHLLNLPWPNPIGLREINQMPTVFLERWGVTLGYFLANLLRYVVILGWGVTVGRAMGFPLLRCSYKPYQATSIFGLLKRIQHYYADVLERLIIYPIWRASQGGLWRKVRLFFALFLSIFVGGLILHGLLDTHLLFIFGPVRGLELQSPNFFYLLALGLFSGSWLVVEKTFRWPRSSFKNRAIEFLIILVLFMIIRILASTFQNDTIHDRLRFIASLFFPK